MGERHPEAVARRGAARRPISGTRVPPLLTALTVLLLTAGAWAGETIGVPAVDGDWWQIAPNAPDVGQWATADTNACDFTIYRDAGGRWHLVSCIRGTSAPGQRLFYEWESDRLTDTDWRPVGILDVPRGKRGNPAGLTSVQAPHAFRFGDRYYMFYNSAGARCMTSADGRDWSPYTNAAGSEVFFAMGRDVSVFHDEVNARWIAYYCGTATVDGERRGAMMARTAPAPEGPWSKEEAAVLTEGNPESPFVLKHGGYYYLWQQMRVFRSPDPLNFNGALLVNHMTGTWYDGRYAPEIVRDGDDYYVSGYSRGIHLARMKWVERTPEQVAAWRRQWDAYYAEEMRTLHERERQRQEAAQGGNGSG
jgi:hypothetical protein